MKNLVNNLILIFLTTFLISGCSSSREPSIQQYNSGIKKTKEWIKYNEYAKENKQPILDFVVTTLKYKFGDYTIPNFDTFYSNDPKIVIETKWHNCNESDLFEFKFYAPDGRLAHYKYFIPNRNNKKWTIGRDMNLKGMPVSDILGKWKIEVLVNNKQVITKDFFIKNKDKLLEKEDNPQTNLTVGFAPFIDSKDSTWKHGKGSSIYISQAILRDNKNSKIIPPYLVLKDIGNPQFDYNSFEKQLVKDLSDNNGVIKNLINKHSMDYLVVGKVKSHWISDKQTSKFNIFIIDTKNMSIINKTNTQYFLTRNDFNVATRKKVEGIHPQRIKIYKQLYDDIRFKIK